MTNLFMKVNKDLFKLKLNPTEILILSQVLEYQNNTNDCFISNQVLADQFGVSVKTISRTIEGLESKGLLTRDTKNVKGGKERHMRVNLAKIEEELTKDNLSIDNTNSNNNKGQNDHCTKDNLSIDKGQNDSIKDNIIDNSIKDNLIENHSVGENYPKVSRNYLHSLAAPYEPVAANLVRILATGKIVEVI